METCISWTLFRGFIFGRATVVLRCLRPSGEIAWELTIDKTNHQPVFESYICPSGSYLVLVRHFNGMVKSARQGIKLSFVATGNGDTE